MFRLLLVVMALSVSLSAFSQVAHTPNVWKVISVDYKAEPTFAARLQRMDVEVIQYLGDNQYLVSYPSGREDQAFTTLLQPREVDHGIKINKDLTEVTNVPREATYRKASAQAEDYYKLMVFAYPNADIDAVAQQLTNLSLEILDIRRWAKVIVIKSTEASVNDIADLNAVRYVDYNRQLGEKEDLNGRNMHRVNWLNNEQSGAPFSGNGINVMVRDDGAIGPHIDFEGRTNQESIVGDNPASTHGDMVAGILAGAGNVNPDAEGMAPGAFLFVTDYESSFTSNVLSYFNSDNVWITSSSYSNGCNDGYTTTTATVDEQVYNNPGLMHVFSAGNANGQDCGYGAGDQWGNITGGHKQGKNVIATANLRSDFVIETSSSRGPAADGRIKPDVAAHGTNQLSTDPNNTYSPGGGTSAAAPGVSGTLAVLYEAYQRINSTTDAPPTDLMKAVLLNGATDMGNVGPDFTFGWGHINARRSYEMLEQHWYKQDQISDGETKYYDIVFPAGARRCRVMLYWHDPARTPSATGKALINDLDLKISDDQSVSYLPWVLDETSDPSTLSLPATHGEDHLNNMEQIIVDGSAGTTLSLSIEGYDVPMASQSYVVVYYFETEPIEIVYPHEGSTLSPTSPYRLYWESSDDSDSDFQIDISFDKGASWTTLSDADADVRSRQQNIPLNQGPTGYARWRVSRDGYTAETGDAIVMRRALSPSVDTVCSTHYRVAWSSVLDADRYVVYQLGDKYMDSIGTTTETFLEVPHDGQGVATWFAVQAFGANGLYSQRSQATYYPGGLKACVPNKDLALNLGMANKGELCWANPRLPLSFLLENVGAQDITDPIDIQYAWECMNPKTFTYNGGLASGESILVDLMDTVSITSSGTYCFSANLMYQDEYIYNDSLTENIIIILNSPPGPVPNGYVQTFSLPTFPPVNWESVSTSSLTWERYSGVQIDGTNGGFALYDNFDDSRIGEVRDLITTSYAIPMGTSTLNFDWAYTYFELDGDTFTDSLEVLFKENCTLGSPERLFYQGGDELSTVDPISFTYRPSTPVDWDHKVLDISHLEGREGRFVFRNINGYGNSLYIDNVNFETTGMTAPRAELVLLQNEACVDVPITVDVNTLGVVTDYLWDLGNGDTSTEAGPVDITYDMVGQYTVELIVSNDWGSDTVSQVIDVLDIPMVDYSFSIDARTVTFTNTSLYANEYSWDLGDGYFSNEVAPVHTYAANGVYIVKLTAKGPCGEITKTGQVVVRTTSLSPLEKANVKIAPNPVLDHFTITMPDGLNERCQSIQLKTLSGILVKEVTIDSPQPYWLIELDDIPAGQYILQLVTEGSSVSGMIQIISD